MEKIEGYLVLHGFVLTIMAESTKPKATTLVTPAGILLSSPSTNDIVFKGCKGSSEGPHISKSIASTKNFWSKVFDQR